ncbi:MAG: DUF2252 domain-containing protein [Gemmataceae bacterium]|jgi:hypothetical protein|nr:DUF2252 domain-containing protein [Gemmataceae bacterium]
MNIHLATQSYETWLRSFFPLNEEDLNYKHEQLSRTDTPFPFFRGTYYRWVGAWFSLCKELSEAPKVIGVGDAHVENFGTWRDEEGRLCWGVNDFDEVDYMAYTQDLVRLSASYRLARQAGLDELSYEEAAKAIIRGYRRNIEEDGHPFVLEELHPELRALAMIEERDPEYYWNRLQNQLAEPSLPLPNEAQSALEMALPLTVTDLKYYLRKRVGVGSLGKPRYVALMKSFGSWIAREAKALTPPATAWYLGYPTQEHQIKGLLSKLTRSPDPFLMVKGNWLVRRLAPRSSRIELNHLTSIRDQEHLLQAMGAELANIHLATRQVRESILKDLEARDKHWLAEATRVMVQYTLNDWKAWRTTPKS